jgi:hypothetical protein
VRLTITRGIAIAALVAAMPTSLPFVREDRAEAEMVAPYPMCGANTRTTRCIQSVYINDQLILPSGNFGGGLSWFQGPTQTASDSIQYPSRFVIAATDSPQGIAFDLTGIASGGLSAETGVNPQWRIRLVVNVGNVPLSYAFISGRLESYRAATASDGSQVIDLVGSPAGVSWYDRLGMYDPKANKERAVARDIVLRECVEPNRRATFARPPSFGAFIQTVFVSKEQPLSDPRNIRPLAMSGMAIAANYGCGDPPIPQWQPATKSLAVDIAAPHFTTTGEVNEGYFYAVLPATYIINVLGISIEEAVSGGVSLAMNNLEVPRSPDTSAVTLLADGSLSVRFEGFHYSKRKFVVRSGAKTRATRNVGGGIVSLKQSKFARGSTVELGFTFTKTLSGNVHAFLLDQKKTLHYLGSTSTPGGSGSLTAVVPGSSVVGRGEILLSRYDSTTAKRTLVRQPVTVTR